MCGSVGGEQRRLGVHMSGSLLSICDIRRSSVFVDVIVLLLFQREMGSVKIPVIYTLLFSVADIKVTT